MQVPEALVGRLIVEVKAGSLRPLEIEAVVSGWVRDELGPGHAAVTDALLRRLPALLADAKAEEGGWADVTDNDRLEIAFEALEAEGVLAVHDVGYTIEDGWDDLREMAERGRWVGGTFYHRQDVERAIAGGGLSLAFGAFPGGDTAEIGARVVAAVRGAGLPAAWEGSPDVRILVNPFVWRRRRTTRSAVTTVALVSGPKDGRIPIMKAVAALLGCDLGTARGVVQRIPSTDIVNNPDGPPLILRRGVPLAEAKRWKATLEALGVVVRLGR